MVGARTLQVNRHYAGCCTTKRESFVLSGHFAAPLVPYAIFAALQQALLRKLFSALQRIHDFSVFCMLAVNQAKRGTLIRLRRHLLSILARFHPACHHFIQLLLVLYQDRKESVGYQKTNTSENKCC